MDLNQTYRQFANRVAEAIIARDFTTAHQMLAPWLQQTTAPETLEQVILANVAETIEIHQLEGEPYPGSYLVDYNTCSLEDLTSVRSYDPDQAMTPDVTVDNFRQWLVIQLLTAEGEELEIDAYMDIWLAIVELNGDCKIGHFEIQDPD